MFPRLIRNDIVIVGNGIDMKKLPMSLRVLKRVMNPVSAPSFNGIANYRGASDMKNSVDTWQVGQLERAIAMKANTAMYSWMTPTEFAEWKHTKAHLHLPDFDEVFGYASDGSQETIKNLKLFLRTDEEKQNNTISFVNDGDDIFVFDLPI